MNRNNDRIKGGILITLGACCYGMLGTFVKLAYQAGFTTSEITISQFGLGFLGLLTISLFRRLRSKADGGESLKSKLRLTAAGTSLGLTSVFYYLSVKYIAVSVAIVLLAQSVWMGVVAEAIIQKKVPGIGKIAAVLMIMAGTLLASDSFNLQVSLDWKGVLCGILGALCYTVTMYSTNHLDTHFPPVKRSLYMILGGLIVILLMYRQSITAHFSGRIFMGRGLIIALFGTVLPPLLFTRGMPLAGMGLGAILASIEIPIAVIMAALLLGERVQPGQWIGVTLVLGSVISMNISKQFKSKTYDNKDQDRPGGTRGL